MKKICIIFAIFSILLFSVFETYAEENIIRLICKYSHTIDADGKSSSTSGKDLVTVTYSNDGKAIIKKQGLGAQFSGTITDEEIKGNTKYKISESTIQQAIVINRYTGIFEITFKIMGSKGGLIHCGSCESVENKKF